MVVNGKAPAVLSIVGSAAALGALAIWRTWALVRARGLSEEYCPSILNSG